MTDAERLTTALAACRAIRFAGNQATRWKGEYSLNDLLAADRLAGEALKGLPQSVTTKPSRRRPK